MNREVLSKYDLITVGELNHTTPEQMLRYAHPDRHELQMGFTFEHVNLGRGGLDMAMVDPHKLSELKEVIARWQGLRDTGAWHALYLENHDQVGQTHKSRVQLLTQSASPEVSLSMATICPNGELDPDGS
jgi:glycosidase